MLSHYLVYLAVLFWVNAVCLKPNHLIRSYYLFKCNESSCEDTGNLRFWHYCLYVILPVLILNNLKQVDGLPSVMERLQFRLQ